jgi:UDP-N-acetyl-D-glucosamine dehydrogenase
MIVEPRLDPVHPDEGTTAGADLIRRITTRRARVAVVGCGYVGLPLAVAAAEAGFGVLAFDVDAVRIAKLSLGHSTVDDVGDERLELLRRLDQLHFTSHPEMLAAVDVAILAVPTPLRDGGPDLQFVESAAATVGAHMTEGTLVILESTTYPGTTDEVLVPALERASGMQAGAEFAVAYAPERISPGDGHELRGVPRVVGGIDGPSTAAAAALYRVLVGDVYETRSCREAEMAKLVENTFRQVNIALVNELATVAHTLGVDIWDALQAAATKPYGYMPFWPGPGVGGHCIAVDPSYLSWRVESRLGFGLGFVQQARAINNRMPAYVATRVQGVLNELGRPLRGARIHVVGVSYKPGISDVRESPALQVMTLLAASGAELCYSDPFVSALEIGGRRLRHHDASTITSDPAPDLVLLLAATADVDLAMLADAGPAIFDAQGISRGIDHPRVHRL